MAQKPDNVVPFRPLPKERKPRELPKWVPKELVGTVTGWIVLANVAVWMTMIAVSRGAGVFSRFDAETTFAFGSLVPDIIASQPWRMISSAFVHADFGHVAMNMAILWFTGRQLERAFGSGRFALLYFAAFLTGNVFSLVWHLVASPGTSVGASGGVLGVVAGLAAFFWRATGRHSEQTRQWLWFCGFGLIGGLVVSIFGMPVDNAAHLGGMVAGFLLSWYAFAGRRSLSPLVSRVAVAAVFVSGFASIAASLATRDAALVALPPPASSGAHTRGLQALAAKDFVAAERELADAIDEGNIDVPMLRTMHAQALVALGRDDEAMAELQAADVGFVEWRLREPQNAYVAYLHAKTLRLLGRDEDAIAALVESTRLRASDAATWAAIAEQLEQFDRLEAARLAAAKARMADRSYKLLHERINEKIAAKAADAAPVPQPT